MNITGNIRATGIHVFPHVHQGVTSRDEPAQLTRDEPLEEKKMDIRKPKNTEQEIIEITKAFFGGEELEFYSVGDCWKGRLEGNNYFPSFNNFEYRIKQDIPEGYEEVDYRLPKKGELIWSPIQGKVLKTDFNYQQERRIILKKKAPKLEVGQIWKDTSSPRVQPTLKIVEIQDNMVYYITYNMDGKVSCPGKFSVGDPVWTKWLVLQK